MNKKNLTLANQMFSMSSDEVLRIYEMTKKQELLKGKYTLPTKPSSDGRFHIYVKDETKKSGRRAIAKNSIEELIDALLEFENQKVTSSMHFSEVFERCTLFNQWPGG